MKAKILAVIVCLLIVAALASPAQAGGVVAVCDENSLRAAMEGGGTVTFACDGTITLADTITIATDTIIDGSGYDITISGGDLAPVFVIEADVSVTLNELTITEGYQDEDGGGIVNEGTLTLSNSIITDNHVTEFGGGIYNDGDLIVTGTTFTGNSAESGGAIFNSGTTTVSSSTFSSNEADAGGAIGNYSSVTVSNSTFSGNEAGNGGAIHSDTHWVGGPGVTLINTTVAGNMATTGAVVTNAFGKVELKNTIVANQPSPNCSGTITSGGGNLSSDATCAAEIVGDPLLGALQDNGGATHTMAIATGSPAIDAAVNETCAAAPVNNLDQRSYSRPIDGDMDTVAVCDIGAFEFGPPPSTTEITSVTPDPAVTGQPFDVAFTVTSPGGTATGSVTVTVAGSGESCTASLSSGSGSCSLTVSAPGTITLTAAYSGDFFLPSQDVTTHLVVGDSTTSIISVAPQPPMAGEVFTVHFGVTSTAGTPEGSVTVTVGGSSASCTGSLEAGVGSCDLTLDTPGEYPLTAAFTGTGFQPSQAQVDQVVMGASVTTITGISPQPSMAGDPFTVSFSVTSSAGIPAGTVTVTVDGSTETCNAALSGGAGSCQLSLPAVGDYSLTASFSGQYYLDSQDEFELVVMGDSSVTISGIEPHPGVAGEPLAISFSVTSTTGTPTGSVTVTASGSPATCSAVLINGVGSCELTLEAPGDYTLTAAFSSEIFLSSSDTQDHTVISPLRFIYLPVVWQDQS